jgi:hypothetical protein
MASGVLHVPQRHAGVEGQGHECVAQAVGAELDGTVEAGVSGQSAHHAEVGRLVEATAAGGDEHWPVVSSVEVVIEGPGRDRGKYHGGSAAALTGDAQGAVASLAAWILNVGRQRLTDA